MANTKLFHALGLHMHQPPDNLRLLMDRDPRGAEQIIRCYERVPRYARKFEEHARLHVGFSGSLRENLHDRVRRAENLLNKAETSRGIGSA